MRVSRAGPKQKWDMANGNVEWVDPVTLYNIDKIYNFLEEKLLYAKRNHRRIPTFTYTKISKNTGINVKSVQQACHKMAYKFIPIIKISAISFRTKNGGKIGQAVKLLRIIEK